jgi:hypothetical protein
MTFHVCRIDGTSLGEFSEEEFNRKVLTGEMKEHFYWHDGMADWKPVAEYKILAKTQRISFTPPPRTTVKIDMNIAPPPPEKKKSSWQKFFKRR